MKLYVASSWRNHYYNEILRTIKDSGHECYDFRNPAPQSMGFHWTSVDRNWKNWNVKEFVVGLRHPVALDGFMHDFKALCWADAGVLVLPCGKSAHLEAGFLRGRGKPVWILIPKAEIPEPELMYLLAGPENIHDDVHEMIRSIDNLELTQNTVSST